MAVYSDTQTSWWIRNGSVFNIRNNNSWVFPPISIYRSGAWVEITDTSTGPTMLVRSTSLWISVLLNVWQISVCTDNPGTATNEYTVPTSLSGLSVNKVVISSLSGSSWYPQLQTKQYGGGDGYIHELTKNGASIYSNSDKHTDGYQCSATNSWSDRGRITSVIGTELLPGDKLGVKVTVPSNPSSSEGGTKFELVMQWYFN